jgi:hypothetical protein
MKLTKTYSRVRLAALQGEPSLYIGIEIKAAKKQKKGHLVPGVLLAEMLAA